MMLIAALLALTGLTNQIISSNIAQQAIDRQDLSLRIAASGLEEEFPNTVVSYNAQNNVEKIVMEEVPTEFENHDFIDKIGKISGETATIFAWDQQSGDFWRKTTNIIKPDGKRAVGTQLGKKGSVYSVVTKGTTYRGEANILGKDYYTIYQPIFTPDNEIAGILYAGVLSSEINAIAGQIIFSIAGLSLLVLVLMSAGLIVINRSVFQGIPQLTKLAEKMSGGDYSDAAPLQNNRNELGVLARAMEKLREVALKSEKDAAENAEMQAQIQTERDANEAERLAEAEAVRAAVEEIGLGIKHISGGDLTYKFETPFEGNLDELRVNFNKLIANLNDTLGAILGNAGLINDSSDNMRHSADELSKRTEQQAASLEETSAALEEITSTVQEASVQANEAADMARLAKNDTDVSGKVVNDAVSAMEGIEKASNEISNIVSVIDEIAFQTNLLALNAGVEAARAGEAGKGFAVVAQEVRELAQRSATAAKEIQALIIRSTDEISNGVELVKRTGDALAQISGHVTDIDGRISSIAAATKEQATGIQEVRNAVVDMDQMTQRNSTMVDESNTITHQLANQTKELLEAINAFKVVETASSLNKAA